MLSFIAYGAYDASIYVPESEQPELHKLCHKGNIKNIKKYFRINGYNEINIKDDSGKTPFMILCSKNHLDVIKLFLESKYFNSLYEKDDYERTGFWHACEKGHYDVVRYLVKLTKNKKNLVKLINEKNHDEESPFYIACEKGHIYIVKFLIKIYMDINDDVETLNVINATEKNGYTPLNVACWGNRTDIVKYLLSLPNITTLNRQNIYDYTPLYYACRRNNMNIVKELLKQKDIIVQQYLDNSYNLNPETRKLIIEYKENPNKIRRQLILEDNIDIYRLIIFMCDDYFELNHNTKNTKGLNFFKIAKQLPLELQMMLIHRMSESSMNNISGKIFNDNLKNFVTKYMMNNVRL
ncbi:MAG: hypothetical protein Terrestrivirus1_327 [Terrestrivirus sp.]|uniref:Uncharacterized protein n=1 Tax=Terrestrivirus sp. TaxID=2487775 RepID=A0A3G4ZPC9_9VIRU|nr:MAG: hypothetical protein Terrestrivirus1_327 [Terrestrivirus sp.]